MLRDAESQMFWCKRERRTSSPEERAEFDRQKIADETERREIEQRLEFLKAEAEVLLGHSDLERRRT